MPRSFSSTLHLRAWTCHPWPEPDVIGGPGWMWTSCPSSYPAILAVVGWVLACPPAGSARSLLQEERTEMTERMERTERRPILLPPFSLRRSPLRIVPISASPFSLLCSHFSVLRSPFSLNLSPF